jgi:hypothetical protein
MLEWFERVGSSADIAGLDASSAAPSRSYPTGHASKRDQMGAKTRKPIVDLTSHGVSSGDVIAYGARIGVSSFWFPRILTFQDRQHDHQGATEAYSIRRQI